tara:strand:+ start:554 stop:943 length:390 start_codon:yes stop_codon:yes gene_type:complete
MGTNLRNTKINFKAFEVTILNEIYDKINELEVLVPRTKDRSLNNVKTNMQVFKTLEIIEDILSRLSPTAKEIIADELIHLTGMSTDMWVAKNINEMLDRLKVDPKLRIVMTEKERVEKHTKCQARCMRN